jgi:hypothetical protein
MERTAEWYIHKLRQLKKVEARIRFGDQPVPPGRTLIWNQFFSTRTWDDVQVRYPLCMLVGLDRERRKEVFEEYLSWVYFQYYRENGLTVTNLYDPRLLSLLGLPPGATTQDIKRRFRTLAKRYHPDHGGESARFIELMDAYEKLLGR